LDHRSKERLDITADEANHMFKAILSKERNWTGVIKLNSAGVICSIERTLIVGNIAYVYESIITFKGFGQLILQAIHASFINARYVGREGTFSFVKDSRPNWSGWHPEVIE
jgi:hypothetical protein